MADIQDRPKDVKVPNYEKPKLNSQPEKVEVKPVPSTLTQELEPSQQVKQ
ncbi:MAG: hypothetical protein WC549_00155 [Actinomycetota bacterium]